MTPGGLYGSEFDADDADQAWVRAEKMGYTPVEVIDHNGENVVVVEND